MIYIYLPIIPKKHIHISKSFSSLYMQHIYSYMNIKCMSPLF